MTKSITVNEQNSIQIRDRLGRIYVDPFQMQEEPHDAAYVLITHDHYDHFSPDDIKKVVYAAAKGSDILVLGAFGCGAFQNDPEVVARAYKTALQEFPKVFKQIEFAVYCPPGGSRNYDVFRSKRSPRLTNIEVFRRYWISFLKENQIRGR